MAPLPQHVKDLMYEGWFKNKNLPLIEATRSVIQYIQERTNPPFTPSFTRVKSRVNRWRHGEHLPVGHQQHSERDAGNPHAVAMRPAGEPAPTVLTNPFHANHNRPEPLPEMTDFLNPEPEDHHPGWAAPPPHPYPTPDILYFDHNLRILQPHEINHLSYNADGHLVDAGGYPVTTQQL
ncbi:hypothetical protein JCM8547_005915 [Rhodosporidiobolus lusitaniae]